MTALRPMAKLEHSHGEDMTEFEKRIALTLGIFGAALAPANTMSSICVLAATVVWILRSKVLTVR
jgi:hypothetical protein